MLIVKKIFSLLFFLLLTSCGPNLAIYNNQQFEKAISKSNTGGFGASWGKPTLELAVFESLLRCQAFNPTAVCFVEYLNNRLATQYEKSEWQRRFQNELNNYEQFTDRLYDPGNRQMSNIVALRPKDSKNSSPSVKKESTPKNYEWLNKYNDNDIIPAGSGTGFFINRDGILLSNYHVIQGCASVSLYHNGAKYPSSIIASDRTNDIAIISSSKKSNQYFRVDKDGPSLLEEIFVAGYPLGLKVSNALKISSGRVSSLAGFGDNYANFQLDAAINPGNSGGPIINKKGNVVGIAVTYLPDAQGFNFGIKSSTVNSFVNSNKINFTSPNMTEMSTKDLSRLMNEATVFIECSMKVKDIKAALEKRDTKKVFYSELRN
jgi:S1-C subfamily serine protease